MQPTKRLLIVFVLVLGIWIAPQRVIASTVTQAPQTDISTTCENSSASSSNLSDMPTSGTLYARLTNPQESVGPVNLYFQDNETEQCVSLGTITPTFNGWTKLGTYNLPGANGMVIAAGSTLSAGPYQATIDLLTLPDTSVCTPTTTCAVTYQGFNGTIQPEQLSSAADEVGVYTISPLPNLHIQETDYYSDSEFMYSAKTLKPFDANYLSGGAHATATQVLFTNGETFVTNSTIDMGTDYTGRLLLRSFAYREHAQFLVALIPVLLIALLVGLLAIARLFYRKHHFNQTHGISDYQRMHGSLHSHKKEASEAHIGYDDSWRNQR